MKLTNRECEIVDIIVDGLAHTKDEIAESHQMEKNSTFRKLTAALKQMGFIIYMGDDSSQLHEDMTPFENYS
jgi:DNA-binding CsgD family transcriptional regulator